MKKRKYSSKTGSLMTALLFCLLATFCSCGNTNDLGGDEPTPEPFVPPVTHVYSDSDSSEAIVKQVRGDGTVVLDANAKKLPQKGEIIASGVTKAAPQGFLYRVESVENRNGAIEVKTSPAGLNEVLPEGHHEIELPLGNADIRSVSAPDGRPVAFRQKKSKEVTLLNFEISQDIFRDSDGKKTDKESSAAFSSKVKIGMEMKAKFVCDRKGFGFERVGVEGQLKTGIGASLKYALGKKATFGPFEFYTLHLEPITVVVYGIPIVFTPRIIVELRFDCKGEMYVSMKMINCEWKGKMGCMYTEKVDPNTGKHWDIYAAGDNLLKQFDMSEILKTFELPKVMGGIPPKFGIMGEARLTLSPLMQVSLYNLNDYFNLATGMAGFLKLKGDFSLSTNGDDFKDMVELLAGFNLEAKGRIKYKRWGKEVTDEYKEELTLLEIPLWEPFALTPTFNDFRLTPTGKITDAKQVHLFVSLTKPAFQLLKDEDYGFCYGTVDNTSDDKEWTFISLKNKYDTGSGGTVNLVADIDTKMLNHNTTYYVRPYVKILGKILYKKGGKFTTGFLKEGGGTSSGSITDVTGREL